MVNKIMIEKKQKNITPKRLENTALYYLSRYEASSANLRKVLQNRIYRAKLKGVDVPAEVNQWIDDIVSKMLDYGYVDDARYTANLVKRMKASGKSKQKIQAKLALSGIDGECADEVRDYDDIAAALTFAKKHKLGLDKEKYQKDLARLGRAGFSYEAAVAALQQEAEQGQE